MFTDALIILLLIFGAFRGYKRGFITVSIDLSGLILALLIANSLYHPLANLLNQYLKLIPTFSQAVSYLIIVTLVEVLFVLAVHRLLIKIPHTIMKSELNRAGGAIANFFRSLGFIIVALVVFAALPISADSKQPITGGAVSQLLLGYTARFQQAYAKQFGGAVTDTLNFFTVSPESDKSIALGFTTTDVKVDPADEDRMLVLLNHERTSRGLSALTTNIKAQTAARDHSRDMFARGYFSHITPEGYDPFQRMKTAGVSYGAAGENLALAPTLDLAHAGLMNSPGHKANILSPDYHTVGIGVIDGGPYGLMITQDFTD